MVSSLISSEDLERAAGSTTSLPLTGQSPEARVKSGTLYYLLVLLCTGKALFIFRTVEVGNGVEGWRVLSARYDRRDTTSTTGLLQAILGFEMSDDLERITDKLAEFELMVQRYNMTSRETLSGQVEIATILRRARCVQRQVCGRDVAGNCGVTASRGSSSSWTRLLTCLLIRQCRNCGRSAVAVLIVVCQRHRSCLRGDDSDLLVIWCDRGVPQIMEFIVQVMLLVLLFVGEIVVSEVTQLFVEQIVVCQCHRS